MSLSNLHKSTKQSWLSKTFPTPGYMTLNPVGLDISRKSIRIMRLVHSKDGFVPSLYEEIKFKESCDFLENEKDLNTCDELREALKKLKAKYGFTFVSVSLPEMKTYIFKIKVPVEAFANLREAVQFQIEENVPLNPRDVVFDYKILSDESDVHDGHKDVIVTALPKSVVRTYTSLFKQVGLMPILFESDSHSIGRAVISSEDKNPYLIINFNDTEVSVSIVEKNIVQYTSSIPVSPKEVMADFNGPEAQLMKKNLNKLLVYWFTNKQDSYNQDRIENAILTGSAAATPGLIDFLEKHLTISVKIANIWENCFSLDEFVPPIGRDQSLDYAVSIGLSLIYK